MRVVVPGSAVFFPLGSVVSLKTCMLSEERDTSQTRHSHHNEGLTQFRDDHSRLAWLYSHATWDAPVTSGQSSFSLLFPSLLHLYALSDVPVRISFQLAEPRSPDGVKHAVITLDIGAGPKIRVT